MRFCEDHWERLRAAITERGLDGLIAPDGETAVAQIADQIERAGRGEDVSTPANYDPLMAAHWAIASNVMGQIGQSALYLMGGGDEAPVEGYDAAKGRTWPRCSLCYINLAHELTCRDVSCTLDKERGFEWMIDRAADDQVERAAEIRKQAG